VTGLIWRRRSIITNRQITMRTNARNGMMYLMVELYHKTKDTRPSARPEHKECGYLLVV